MKPLFPLGNAVATPGALEAMSKAKVPAIELLARHQLGDWGDMPDEDKQENDLSVYQDLRIFSAYKIAPGSTVWIITEADRSVTTILLPDEY